MDAATWASVGLSDGRAMRGKLGATRACEPPRVRRTSRPQLFGQVTLSALVMVETLGDRLAKRALYLTARGLGSSETEHNFLTVGGK